MEDPTAMESARQASFSLGSNLGDRESNLDRAVNLLQDRLGPVESLSGVYETAPWGFSSEHPFLNQCALVRISRSPLEVLGEILRIEKEMGRVRREEDYTDRIIDIDLLLFGQEIIREHRLEVPHPRMLQRRFVLVPLAEILPEKVVPGTGRSILWWLEHCPDPSPVRLVRSSR